MAEGGRGVSLWNSFCQTEGKVFQGHTGDVAERAFSTDETIQDVVLRICAEYDFPILFGLDFGHTRDKLTLPLGLEAEFDSQCGELL